MYIYTYLVGWSTHQKFYYGVRKSKKHPEKDLWNIYKTSSEYVKSFHKQHGEPDIIQVRKEFSDHKSALLWENKVLKKMNVTRRDDFLNKSVGGGTFYSCDPDTRKKISEAVKGRPAWNKGIPNPKQSERMKKNNPNKDGKYGFKWKKGHIPWNKEKTVYKYCLTCWNLFRATKDKKSCCNKSCAATFSNHKRYIKRLNISMLDYFTASRRTTRKLL
jgi:hypothetical protein